MGCTVLLLNLRSIGIGNLRDYKGIVKLLEDCCCLVYIGGCLMDKRLVADYESVGREFESLRARQFFGKLRNSWRDSQSESCLFYAQRHTRAIAEGLYGADYILRSLRSAVRIRLKPDSNGVIDDGLRAIGAAAIPPGCRNAHCDSVRKNARVRVPRHIPGRIADGE